ncbi:hypothetical protein IMX07_10850 [bacterium]|jgi:hypothetical protein|nr:hypothetical protein [bacterium]
MNPKLQWAIHAALAVLGGFVATGAIFDPAIVPPHLQHYVIVLLPVLFYLGGVRMPTPGSAAIPAPAPQAHRTDGKVVDEKRHSIDLD